jgi:hypothetical protein
MSQSSTPATFVGQNLLPQDKFGDLTSKVMVFSPNNTSAYPNGVDCSDVLRKEKMKSSKQMLSIHFVVSARLYWTYEHHILIWHSTPIVCSQIKNPLIKNATNLISQASKGLPSKLPIRSDSNMLYRTNRIHYPCRHFTKQITCT